MVIAIGQQSWPRGFGPGRVKTASGQKFIQRAKWRDRIEQKVGRPHRATRFIGQHLRFQLVLNNVDRLNQFLTMCRD